jgi:hypothetical protein
MQHYQEVVWQSLVYDAEETVQSRFPSKSRTHTSQEAQKRDKCGFCDQSDSIGECTG